MGLDLVTFWQFSLSGLTFGCVYALVALGFVLCVHVSGVINFAQGEYAMVGGVATAMLVSSGWPLAVAIAGAVVIGALLGVLQERLTLAPVRRQSLFIQVTITLVVAGVIRSVALVVGGKDPLSVPSFGSEDSFELFGAILPDQTLWVWGTTAALLAGVFFLLHRTDIGRAIRACASNMTAARLMGVDVAMLTMFVYAGGGALGALVGAIVAPMTQAHWIAGIDFGLKGFVGAIIGNFRSPALAVVGGLGIGLVESFAAGYISSAYKDVIAYGVLLFYLLLQGGVFASRRATLAIGTK